MMSLDIALLRKAVDWAKEEDRRKKQHAGGAYGLRDQGEHTWLQNAWATITLRDRWGKDARRLPNFSSSVAINPMSCGSTGCIAGHICVLAGDDYVIPMGSEPGETLELDYVADAEGTVYSIGERALSHLGISEDVAGALFSGSNRIELVEEIAGRIAKQCGEKL